MNDDEEVPTLIEPEPEPERSDGETPRQVLHQVPLTIISGFLGAGKSTLLKRILTEHHGYRIAVIMNEFGDTAVSRAINVSSASDPLAESSEEFLELSNGCLCCSIKDSGIAAIEKLMQRKGAFDYILLETTGLADPGPIASIFWRNEEFNRGKGKDIVLDGVVCVVDALFGKQQMEEDHAQEGIGESLRQIAAADVILLNKTDLVSAADLQATEALLSKINPAVAVHRTVRADIDLKHVLDVRAYASRALSRAGITPSEDHDHASHDDEKSEGERGNHHEVRGITSLRVSCPVLSPEQLERLEEWIRTGVRNLYELEPLAVGDVGLPEHGKLVLIGKGLDDVVRKSLENIIR
ncbi:CobW domain-containing protein [Russula earlei]|uniref:CobW domain-containing protein n=1 Tax=Russula earlei TaxID=71964 RepID=A0ACC0UL63_9AGAM|nr:CobW domain-containing protein [Russula earlei]